MLGAKQPFLFLCGKIECVLPLCVWEGKRGRGAKYCAPRAELSSCRPTYQQCHEREHQREHD